MTRSQASCVALIVLFCVAVQRADGGGPAGGFSLVPVGASGSHVINGDEITVPSGGTTVILELRVLGWDPQHNNDPRVRAYQAQINSAGYTSGSSGFLTAGYSTCQSSADCPNGWSCGGPGFCDAVTNAFINQDHPNYMYLGLQDIAAVDRSQPNYRFGALVDAADAVSDTGSAKYGGTLRLIVSPDASGTFTVGLKTDTGECFFLAHDNLVFPPAQTVPARITISTNDCNVNGVLDEQDIANGTSDDCNGNGTPDECEPDCNGNEQADDCDLALGCSNDCNGNDVPDDCEADCNKNGAADACDIAGGGSADCDDDGIPDECQGGSASDCNNNGTPDRCDIANGTSSDCNGNDVPDSCELSGNDCNGNNVPDDCEPDCNSNGTADACDISSGSSTDVNGDGVPDDCFTHIAWRPTGASTGHYISGNDIMVPAGGTRVTLEAFFTGWDLDRDGNPLLHVYQFTFDSASLTSGSSGSLFPAAIACSNNNDCFGESACISGVCDNHAAAFVDNLHADFLFSGHSTIYATDVSQPNYRWGSVITNSNISIPDVGRVGYAGTLILDATGNAAGTFTISFLMGANDSFYGGVGGLILPIGASVPATITIVDDCNDNGESDRDEINADPGLDCDGNGFLDECDLELGDDPDCNGNGQLDVCEDSQDCNANGRVDLCDILSGDSDDANSNGVPDECESSAPAVSASGARYLEVTPAPSSGTVALRVVSPDHPCLVRYVEVVNGMGRLSDAPVFKTPAQWGSVRVGDSEITPDAMYDVYVDYDDGRVSPPSRTITGTWGDIVAPFNGANFGDISEIVDAFREVACAVAVEIADLHPAVPNHVVNFSDISAGVDAFRGLPYPYAQPCP